MTQDKTEAILVELAGIMDEKGLLTGYADCQRYASDQSGLIGQSPLAVLRPDQPEMVASLLAFCESRRLAVIPQGGRTGLSGGACASHGAILLSTERLTGIEEIDPHAMTITVRAGTPLQTVQEAALAQNLEYGVDIGARGSATIGGTIATNAGGIRVLQHGMTRQNVLGLEVVLPGGQVISRLGKTVKDNSGLDLKQLFIGSEGILGVVTRAVLQLRPHRTASATALLALPDHAAALTCLASARRHFGADLMAFEVMWPDYWDHVCGDARLVRPPFPDRHGFYVLIEAAQETGACEEFFGELHEAGLVRDGVLAQSSAEAQALWSIREAIGEVDASFGPHVNFDIGVAPSRLGRFCDVADQLLSDLPEARGTLKVGHAGDGNVHLLVAHDGSTQAEEAVEAEIYRLVETYEGAVTAEHGVGRLKTRWLRHSRSATEIDLMQKLKNCLDPHGIMNPGVIV